MVFTYKKIAAACLMTLLGLAGAGLVYAQTIEDVTSYDTSVNEGDFEFEVTPQNPGPFEDVTVRVTSNLVDANRYPITWTLNDRIVSQGIGKRSITFKTRNYGDPMRISMSIRLIDSTVVKEISIAPQDSTLLWEALDSYVPPFYQGKKLPAPESFVRITSIPNFLSDKTSTATKNAVYNWKRAGKVVPDGSGYGKDSLTIQHNRIRTVEKIDVTSSSVNGSSQATSTLNLSFNDPQIRFYEIDPASGLKSPFARRSVSTDRPTENIEVVPYFFSVTNGNPDSLTYEWRMNNRTLSLSPAKNKDTLTLQNPGGNGTSALQLTVTNAARLFQSASQMLDVSFEGQ